MKHFLAAFFLIFSMTSVFAAGDVVDGEPLSVMESETELNNSIEHQADLQQADQESYDNLTLDDDEYSDQDYDDVVDQNDNEQI